MIVSADECANGKFRNIIILNEDQKGIINVPIICRGMKYADCGMVSYGVCNRFENFVRVANENEWKEIHDGIAKAFGFEFPEEGGSKLAERWKERCEKTQIRLYEVEQEVKVAHRTIEDQIDQIGELAEKLTFLEKQPVFAPDPDEVIRLKAQVEMLERQNEKLLDRLIG